MANKKGRKRYKPVKSTSPEIQTPVQTTTPPDPVPLKTVVVRPPKPRVDWFPLVSSVGPPRPVWIAGIAYALMIAWIWGTFAFRSGMPYETSFAFNSEEGGSLLHGLFYNDFTRPHTSTFYHVSYLLGELIHLNGSFVPFQFVYAFLWWTKGFLLFLIVRRLMPANVLIAYVAGAVTVCHASDRALQWVGQLNQFGFTFWMMLAFYLLALAVDSRRLTVSLGFLLVAAFCQHMSLWSYESGFLILTLFPITVLLTRWPVRRRLAGLLAAWYLVPALYVAASILKYVRTARLSYQTRVMRTHWNVLDIAGDWIFNVRECLSPWRWGTELERFTSITTATALGLCAALTFLAGWVLLKRSLADDEVSALETAKGKRAIVGLLVAGGVWVVASFPVYLLLDSARGLWRTQLLSGPGAGLLVASAAVLLSRYLPPQYRRMAALCLATMMIARGGYVAVQFGARHQIIWEKHRRVVAAILRSVPQVKPGTVFVLTGLTKKTDPFGDSMWFDFALRLAYPRIPVDGVYYYPNHTPSPGQQLQLTGDTWAWKNIAVTPMIETASLGDTIFLELRNGTVELVDKVPDSFCANTCTPDLYQPRSRITASVPSPRAIRRYSP